MRSLDQLFEQSTRSLAQRTSRRSLLGTLGRMLTGAALLPLLPLDRAGRARADEVKADPSSQESCEYWKYCAIDGFLCACCGGTSTSCPPGSVPSPITWIGTCHNPKDARDYIVSYNDCCGKTSCGHCDCNRNGHCDCDCNGHSNSDGNRDGHRNPDPDSNHNCDTYGDGYCAAASAQQYRRRYENRRGDLCRTQRAARSYGRQFPVRNSFDSRSRRHDRQHRGPGRMDPDPP